MFRFDFKNLYFLNCLILSIFLVGCKGNVVSITAFDKLPDSAILSEAKASFVNKKPLVVAFTAEWCPHCREYKPVFHEVKNSFTDKVTFINADVDDKTISSIISRFQVRGIPTTAFIRRDGSVFKVQVGEIAKESLTKITNELLASKKKEKDEPVAPFPIEEPKVENVQENTKEEEGQQEESESQLEEESESLDSKTEDSAVDNDNQEINEEQNLESEESEKIEE